MYYIDNGQMGFRGSRLTAMDFIQLGYTVKDETGEIMTLEQLKERTDDND